MIDQRLQQLLNDDDTGHGIAGNTQDDLASLAAQDGRLAGLHGNAVVQHLAQLSDNPGGEVLPAGRRTGVQDDHIAFRSSLGNHGLDLVKFIGNDGIHLCFGTPLPDHGRENGAVEFQNIAGLGVGAGRNNLITGGDDANHGLADDFDFQHTAGDHGTDGRGRNGHMGRQDHFSCTDILTDLADVLPGGGSSVDGNGAILVLYDILHHDDRIAALGNRVAGVQNDELTGIQCDWGGLRCAEGILCIHSNAIHGAGSIVGGADVGVNRMGSHPSAGIPNRNHFRFCTKAVAFQQCEIVLSCLGKGNVGQILKSHTISISLRNSYLNFRIFRQTLTVPVDAEVAIGTCQSGDQTGLAPDGVGV